LRTLTASYSSDTVNALAIGGMVVHLLACDYSYALGISKKKVSDGSNKRQAGRPTFSGGTVSLNAALFSTTLLASRLPTNVVSYAFISSAVILFAFYPAARHAIAKKSQSREYLDWQLFSLR
jgi:phosphatidylinositol glycan class C protein